MNPQGGGAGADDWPRSAEPASSDAYAAAVTQIHEAIFEQLDLRRADLGKLSDQDLRATVQRLAEGIVARGVWSPNLDLHHLVRRVADQVLGLGPLEPLLADDTIDEIMVNGPDTVFVERSGMLSRTEAGFSSARALRGTIERIIAPSGRRIDEASPMADARLPDGSRVNVVLPPLAVCGPYVTIRKFARRRLRMADLVSLGTLNAEMALLLRRAVECRQNIVVAGGTGSGKTTLLNAISELISPAERVVTIEDAAELQLQSRHVVSLEARPRNLEGRGEVTIRDLVRNALRMRPDRIIVGECRGGEALDMLQAMNTGHAGSLTTAHANSPRDALARLEVMALMAGIDLPATAIRSQIASAVDVIVQQSRLEDGSRRITAIVEIAGMDCGVIQLQELYRFERLNHRLPGDTPGEFRCSGQPPQFLQPPEVPARNEPCDSVRRAGSAS